MSAVHRIALCIILKCVEISYCLQVLDASTNKLWHYNNKGVCMNALLLSFLFLLGGELSSFWHHFHCQDLDDSLVDFHQGKLTKMERLLETLDNVFFYIYLPSSIWIGYNLN